MKSINKLWLGLFILLLLSPLGFILPAALNCGTPWGEWKSEELRASSGCVPAGIARAGKRWSAPMRDYSMRGQEKAPLSRQGFFYFLSGLAGTFVVTISIVIIGRMCSRHEDIDNP